jgi:hypothetical protein
MAKWHSVHKRNRVAQLHAKGFSNRLIHFTLKKEGCIVPLSTIKRWTLSLSKHADQFLRGPKFKKTGNVKAHRQGAQPLSKKDRARVRRMAELFADVSYRKLLNQLPRGVEISRSTLNRESLKYGLISFHRSKKPKLTLRNRGMRLVFAKSTLNFNWRSVVPMDEFTVDLDGTVNMHNMRYRAFDKAEVPTIPTSKGSVTVTRMLVLTSKGGLPLVEIGTNPTAPEMQRVMERVIEDLDEKMGEDYCLLHDNCPGWAAKSTQDFVEERVPAFFPKGFYPGNSPDFNASEHSISLLKQAVQKARPKNKAQLIEVLNREWERISTPERVCRLLDSMPARLASCIKLRGGMTCW